MLKRIVILAGCAALLMAFGCSKVEDAAKETRKKGNEAFDKVVMDPQRKAEEAKDKVNAALKNLDKSIERATEDAKDEIDDFRE